MEDWNFDVQDVSKRLKPFRPLTLLFSFVELLTGFGRITHRQTGLKVSCSGRILRGDLPVADARDGIRVRRLSELLRDVFFPSK
jgi:hypothetical protein